VLQMSEGGETVALQLDPTQSFAGHSFALARDGHGGTTVVDPSPTLTTLYYFSGTDGSDPDGGVIVDAAGDLFGTTANGGKRRRHRVRARQRQARLSPAQPGWLASPA
jgi:hypothetical protein